MPEEEEREPLLPKNRASSFDEDEVGRQLKEPLKAQPFMKDFFEEEEAKKKKRDVEERKHYEENIAAKKLELEAKERRRKFTQLSFLSLGFLLLAVAVGFGLYEAWSYFTASTLNPTSSPSMLPSSTPSFSPSLAPTSSRPTPNPSFLPSRNPTPVPTTPSPSIHFDERSFVPTTPRPTSGPTVMPTPDPTIPAPTPVPSLYRWPPTRMPTPKPIDSRTATPFGVADSPGGGGYDDDNGEDDSIAKNGEIPPSGWSPKKVKATSWSRHMDENTIISTKIRSSGTQTRSLRFVRRHRQNRGAYDS